MYESYYRMQSKAFPAQPTPAVFFESQIHQGAYKYLITGIEEHEPFLLIVGRYGMGKTLLCLRLLRYLRKEAHPFLNIPSPVVSYRELLEHILYSWGVSPQGDSEQALQTQLFHYLDQHLTPGRYFSLILDEMQDYQLSTLAKIRMLSNYNCDGFYPFQFIFFGHNDFLELLSAPPLASLQQRIRRRYTLTPFSFEETREYIYYRLLQSGALGSPCFPDDTIHIIHSRTEGIPRLINNLCDACLLIGAAKGLDTIGRQPALDAAENLGLPTPLSVSDWPTGAFPPSAAAEPEADSIHAQAGDPDAEETATDYSEDVDEELEERGFKLSDVMPLWAWRVVTGILLLLLLWLLAMQAMRMLPPSSLAGGAADTADPLYDGSEKTPREMQQRDPLLGAAPRDGNAGLHGDQPSPAERGLIGYLGEKEQARQQTEEAETDDDIQSRDAEDDSQPERPADAKMPEAYPVSLQLGTAPERNIAVALLWQFQAQGIPGLHLGQIKARDGTPRWAVLQGYYPNEDHALQAQNNLDLSNAAARQTPFAVQVPVANAGDLTLQGYLREAGYWPYSIPQSPTRDRLLVGAFETRAMAENWRQEMETRGFEARVVSR